MGRRLKPKIDPAELAARERVEARKPENWGIDRSIRRQADISLVVDAKGKPKAAHRSDVFDRLHARGALSEAAHQAVRRLDEDMTERRGDGAASRDFGQSTGVAGSRDLVSQRSLDAGRRVDAVLRLVGRRDAELLVELLEPRRVLAGEGVDRWRVVVKLICGETRSEVQAGAVRAAAENLALAYGDLDRATRGHPGSIATVARPCTSRA